jgi:hypothetical protein
MSLLASPSLLRKHSQHLSGTDLTIHRRLDEIQSSSTTRMGENRNVLVRLMDAEHVAKQLEGIWADIQLAYNELIVHLSVFDHDAEADGLTQATTVISTEIKVDDVRQDMGRMQVRVLPELLLVRQRMTCGRTRSLR